MTGCIKSCGTLLENCANNIAAPVGEWTGYFTAFLFAVTLIAAIGFGISYGLAQTSVSSLSLEYQYWMTAAKHFGLATISTLGVAIASTCFAILGGECGHSCTKC